MDDIMRLSDRVRETAYAIHVFHGNGHLERIYENALAHRLRKIGLKVDQQCPVSSSMKMEHCSAATSLTWW